MRIDEFDNFRFEPRTGSCLFGFMQHTCFRKRRDFEGKQQPSGGVFLCYIINIYRRKHNVVCIRKFLYIYLFYSLNINV